MKATLLWLALVGALVSATQAQSIKEFPLPTAESGPRGIVAGWDGNLWFTEVYDRVGRMTTAGDVAEFETGYENLVGITVGPDRNIWFTVASADAAKVCRITPEGDVITEFGEYDLFAGLAGITSGPDGNVWFTDTVKNRINRITLAGGVTGFGTDAQLDGPVGITAGPDGNLWFTERTGNRIGRITPDGDITQFPIPTVKSAPYGIAPGPDGNLWFTESSRDKIGRITPHGEINEFPLGAGRGPADIVAGPDGNLWFTETDGNRIGRISTSGGAITEYALPRPDSGPTGIAVGPDGRIWFTERTGNRIGRLDTGQHGSCAPDAATLCLNEGRFRVRTRFTTRDGVEGDGQAVALTGDTGYFTFFDPANIEVVAKILSGCSLNERYWMFAGGLTNVRVVLTVSDTKTGFSTSYESPLGTPFAPIQDTNAFATCP